MSRQSLRPRPFLLTRGRTRPAVDVTAETIVQAKPAGSLEPQGWSSSDATAKDHQWALLDFCDEPQSVASVSDHFALPLQVAKILVADLIVADKVEITNLSEEREDLELLKRVLDGLASS